MAADIEARLKLLAIDRTQKAFNSVARNMDRIDRKAKQVERSQSLLGRTQAGIVRSGAAAEAALLRVAAPAALAYGAMRTVNRFAGVERAVNRIGITADATAGQTKGAFGVIQKAAFDYATTQDEVTRGLDALVAAGQGLPEALEFLPSVAATAQASGADIVEIATTADAMATSLKITGERMQNAFDILVAGGQAGKFELKDMAAYLPSLAPAFQTLGYEGEAGLKKLVSALQIVRDRTGSASEAATAFANVLQKMETEETANKFRKFGIDIRREMDAARKEGRDLIEVFVEMTEKAVNGDLSKLPQLFGDAQMLTGMRALIQGGEDLDRMIVKLGQSAGATSKALDVLLSDKQAKIDRMTTGLDRLATNLGGKIANVASPPIDALNHAMGAEQARELATAKEEARGGSRDAAREEFYRRYERLYEAPSWITPIDRANYNMRAGKAFLRNWARYGEGELATPYAELDHIRDARKGGRFASGADARAASAAWADKVRRERSGNLDGLDVRHGLAVPASRPGAPAPISLAEQYQSYGAGRRRGEIGGRKIMARDAGLEASISRIESVQARIAAAAEGRAVPPAADPDALRRALEEGGRSVGQGGDDARAAIDQAGKNLPTMGEQAGAALGRAVMGALSGQMGALGAQIAAGFNANVRTPNGGGGALPRANKAPGRTMPDAGQPGG
ncbi:phage tail tape measure protein [Jiella marina]|uniref:phage tail tape measure protein n=1 Tax=Jiella sp. LLJ827 TaxID=2917712 RepID=UPI00210106C8|nr:phage tail tape measure protein [Jiella sp. LLJ827]MCQ0986399.1 phage tail tape measure protein [Jiella sp. LLJ827]